MREKLRGDFQALFNQEWPVWIGGLLVGVINVFLFLFYQPWTTLDGALNWGDWVLGGIGVIRAEALSPLLRSGSVINFGLLLGALSSALLAGQFGIRVGPLRELAKGLVGGVLLGVGAAVARGCNIGGFFSATSAFAASGLVMAVGLAIGAFVGLRFVLWEIEHAPSAGGLGQDSAPASTQRKLQPYFGAAVGIGLLLWALAYSGLGYADRAVILVFGVALGIICQRSRVCFVQAFREPFLTGDTRHTRAMLLGLFVSIVGFALIKTVILEKADEFVRPTFWLGSLVGGLIFGVGMVLAGGCGGGAIWRAGEGHVKLWLAVIGYVFAAALVRAWLVSTKLQEQLGTAVFLPDLWGWEGALLSLLVILLVWFLLAQWNEVTHKLAAL